MSILLEALRKSEKSQRAHEVPTIHTGDEIATIPESLASGPLAIMLISAMFISGWFVWHQYQAPETVNEAAVANTKPAARGQQPPLSVTKDESSSVTTPVAGEARAAQVASSKVVVDKSTGKQRTPMESYKAPARSAPKTKPAGTERVAVAPPPAKTTNAENKPTSTDASVRKPVTVARSETRPELPRAIGYWELPDSVRANVPEIKFSVLVYATKPSDRFVLINGERLVEGGTAGSDLVVKEIRRDGVIFSYRKYQFLVEK